MTGFAVQSCYDDDDSNDMTMNQQISSIWSTCQHECRQVMSPSSSSPDRESHDFQDCNKLILINKDCVWNQQSILAPMPMLPAHTVHEAGMPVVLLRFSLLAIAISACLRQACKLTQSVPSLTSNIGRPMMSY